MNGERLQLIATTTKNASNRCRYSQSIVIKLETLAWKGKINFGMDWRDYDHLGDERGRVSWSNTQGRFALLGKFGPWWFH
jgi:hypothetical protein